MRKSLLAPATALLAVVLAACSSTGATTAPSAASAAPTAAPSVAASASAAPSPTARRVRRRQARPGDAGDLHDRHRQPGLPAVLRAADRREHRRRGTRRRATRPPGRASRARSATPSPTSSASPKDKVAWVVVPVRELVRARTQDLRHRPEPGHLHDRPHADRRPLGRLLLRPADAWSRSRPTSSPRRRPSPSCRAPSSASRSAPRATTRSTNVIKPTTETAVFDTNDAAIQALKQQAGRRHRRRPADRGLHHQRPARRLHHRRPARRRAQPEHFSAVLAKGSALTPCVNAAIKALDADGTLASLVTKYLPSRPPR